MRQRWLATIDDRLIAQPKLRGKGLDLLSRPLEADLKVVSVWAGPCDQAAKSGGITQALGYTKRMGRETAGKSGIARHT